MGDNNNVHLFEPQNFDIQRSFVHLTAAKQAELKEITVHSNPKRNTPY